MGDAKARRIDDALSSLVNHLIPALSDEDEALTDERRDEGLDLARNILEGFVLSCVLLLVSNIKASYRHEGSAGASDINHISDLIKQKRI